MNMIILIIILCIGLIPIAFTWFITRSIQNKNYHFFIRVAVITIVHFCISFVLGSILSMDGLCMANDDSDLEDCSSLAPNLEASKVFYKIIIFPIYIFNFFGGFLLIRFFGIYVVDYMVILNSCLWGFGITFLINKISNK